MHRAMPEKCRSRSSRNFVNEITFESHNFIKVGRFSVRFRHRGDIQGPVAAGMRHGIQPPWRKRTENLPTLRKLWLSNVISLTQCARLLLPRKNDSAPCIKRPVRPAGMQGPAREADGPRSSTPQPLELKAPRARGSRLRAHEAVASAPRTTRPLELKAPRARGGRRWSL